MGEVWYKTLIYFNYASLYAVLSLLSLLASLVICLAAGKMIVAVVNIINDGIRKRVRKGGAPMKVSEKVPFSRLREVKSNLKQIYPMDNFLILREPAAVWTSGQPIFLNLAGISAWHLENSFVHGQREDSDLDTEASMETITCQQLFKQMLIHVEQTIRVEEESRAEILFHEAKKYYPQQGVTVMVSSCKWVGLWNAKADCQFRKKYFGHNILIILS